MNRERLLDDLAGAVLDGAPVDWQAVESGADEAARPALRRLKLVASVAAVHRDAMPEHWGHLHLIERIGAGAFGEVYRAWDSRLDREVALKLLPVDHRAGSETERTVIREGRLLAKITHPNVVTIYGAERIEGRVGLWMELVHGRTLEDLLKSGATFTPDEVVRIGRELSAAIGAVHAAGLVHRDVKAQNVMREDGGRIVLMDFGTGEELARPGPDVAGTPLYLAPEVLAGAPASVQSDVYGLGVVLFRLLTGAYPVTGSSAREIRAAHERGTRTRLRDARPDLPRRLARVVDQAIDPQPHRRHEGADALGTALAPLSRESRRRRAAYVSGIAGVAALVGLSWYVSSQRPGARGDRVSVASFPLGPATTPWWSAPRPAGRPVMVVLPIRGLAAGRQGDPLADGLTYELTERLATVEGVDLVASGSAFELDGIPAGALEARDRLGADFVVTGQLESSTDLFRVRLTLTRAADSVPLWTRSFEVDRDGLSTLPDEIARAIVSRLNVPIGPRQRQTTIDPDAYLDYLTARGLQARYFHKSEQAAMLFESAVARDPSFAKAWSGLAGALGWMVRLAAPGEVPPSIEPKLRGAALEALRLDPDLAEAHAALGGLHALDGEWADAEAAFARALELNPSLTEIHTDAAWLLLFPLGRFDHTLELLALARDVNPLGLDVHRSLACMQLQSGRSHLYDDAIRTAQWALDRDPELEWADVCLGRAMILSGRAEEAVPIFDAKPQYWHFRAYLAALRGSDDEARAVAEAHPEAPARQMLIYAGLGDVDRAFELLEEVAKVNPWRAATWMQWPEVAILRADPRYGDLRRRLGVPE